LKNIVGQLEISWPNFPELAVGTGYPNDGNNTFTTLPCKRITTFGASRLMSLFISSQSFGVGLTLLLSLSATEVTKSVTP
jgi:hypothetical protein